VRPENLMAMCAPCHLRYDAKHHAETRKRKKESYEQRHQPDITGARADPADER
jgi:hypothetical protein